MREVRVKGAAETCLCAERAAGARAGHATMTLGTFQDTRPDFVPGKLIQIFDAK